MTQTYSCLMQILEEKFYFSTNILSTYFELNTEPLQTKDRQGPNYRAYAINDNLNLSFEVILYSNLDDDLLEFQTLDSKSSTLPKPYSLIFKQVKQ